MATAPSASDWRIILVGHSFIKRLHRFSQDEGDCHTPFSLSHAGTVGWKFKGGATLVDISSRPWVEEIRRFRRMRSIWRSAQMTYIPSPRLCSRRRSTHG